MSTGDAEAAVLEFVRQHTSPLQAREKKMKKKQKKQHTSPLQAREKKTRAAVLAQYPSLLTKDWAKKPRHPAASIFLFFFAGDRGGRFGARGPRLHPAAHAATRGALALPHRGRVLRERAGEFDSPLPFLYLHPAAHAATRGALALPHHGRVLRERAGEFHSPLPTSYLHSAAHAATRGAFALPHR